MSDLQSEAPEALDDLSVVVSDVPGADLRFPLCALLLRTDVTLSSAFEWPDGEDWDWFAIDLRDRRPRALPRDAPDDDARIQVAIRRRRIAAPGWRALLAGAGVPVTVADGEQESALVAVRTSTRPVRTLLWCFGRASLSISSPLTENRFGLIVALNKHAAGPDLPPWRDLPADVPSRRLRGDPTARVRGTVHQVRDGYPHRATSRSSGPAPLEGLRFDDLSDLLRSLSLRTQDELMSDLEGGRTLRFSTYIGSLAHLATLADHLVQLRDRSDYQAEWDWIDRFLPVEDATEMDDVLHELFDRLVGPQQVQADLLMPTLPDDEDTAGRVVKFAFPRERRLDRQTLTMDVLRAWLRRNNDANGAELLRSSARFALEGHERDEPLRIPLRDLLVAELRVEEQDYMLSDGEILRVDGDFLAALGRRLADDVPWSDFPFPTYEGGTEPAYLETAGERSAGRLLMLDDDPIRLPGETPFEVCDLISDDHRLVFGKLKGRSSLFSHLAVQVETSAEMLVRSGEARRAFLNAVRRRTDDPTLLASAEFVATALEAHRADQVTITMLLLGSWKARSLTALPLVSRIRLRRTAQKIAALGYRLEIAAPDQHRGHLPTRPVRR